MINNKQIEKITNLTYRELNIPLDVTKWTQEHEIKSKLMNDTLTVVMTGTILTFNALETIEVIRKTLDGLQLIITENRKPE